MSSRIAHRPHYRAVHKAVPPAIRSQQSSLRTRWHYRNSSFAYEKHGLGYQLSLFPLSHRLMRQLVLYRAF